MQLNEEELPASIEKTLRKGNINFDFLQPENASIATSDDKVSNRRTVARQGKRGLFNRGRLNRPFKKIQLIATILICILQIFLLFAIAMSNNFIWLLFVPIVMTVFLGSLIMMTLLLVKPL
ncbi:hypothetical protein [Leptospira sp. GIMC2001]|uniref:hypothetical protein n=1 Tax=Leptospira sp. GIMC2001 TaxID=1513297 RepID=UPI0023499286|nr:hypothetical protein [Leptospira sp. GIMC2001]WCL50895.1 hypothetical protein O4O04_08810 [Leptospira sp. GIMC2001]